MLLLTQRKKNEDASQTGAGKCRATNWTKVTLSQHINLRLMPAAASCLSASNPASEFRTSLESLDRPSNCCVNIMSVKLHVSSTDSFHNDLPRNTGAT